LASRIEMSSVQPVDIISNIGSTKSPTENPEGPESFRYRRG